MPKTTTSAIRVIESTKRLTSSVNGNPAFRVFFTDGSSARTKSDSSCAYEIQNLTHSRYRGREVAVTFTRAGNIETIALFEQFAPLVTECVHTTCDVTKPCQATGPAPDLS